MGDLTGKAAFVTGAARGQGRAHAVRLARDGADVIAVDVCAPVPPSRIPPATLADLEETARLVRETGRGVVARVADVRDLAALRRVVAEGVERFGGLDIVVANAGIATGGPTVDLTEDAWLTTVDVNLSGAWRTCAAAVPAMVETGRGGSIVLTSSIAGLRGLPLAAAYSASKHGLVGLCRVLALELAGHDIRVNTIHPHGVNTPMANVREDLAPGEAGRDHGRAARTGGLDPAVFGVLGQLLPVGRIAEPEEIAAVVSWLVSADARFLTGAQIPIDFGNQLL
ncbi:MULTISPECIES: mycofactocin-coupled SDR family oxidoreductase [unclassified Pseudofrankia]|uniref:mycofactocin-coupled SDR family oxidoreductase n=1 Tax=unclassified Pseudofrankia TaxID=2994372 RepID=UPI0008D93AEE|nr:MULTISPECIES: mycofactocin-coupled SDR family oxidoreductase [unclassified Pseudofrankia]MDT3441921.1 mycofactocin-coupled SDR family oxidoreductase [Pseudofrankia sp. BMG5.37]OHV44564.1 hypothetical protein BCD48_25230 [Pseudofrankia sp. BMG5.36]